MLGLSDGVGGKENDTKSGARGVGKQDEAVKSPTVP